MHTELTREKAIQLLREYNKEPFHIRHGLTVGGVLKWYANELGYGEEADFWEICGILHDIDFEQYPEEPPMSMRMEEKALLESLSPPWPMASKPAVRSVTD